MGHNYSEELREVSRYVAECRNGYEMLRLLADNERENSWEGEAYQAFDTCEALYYVASQWHEGQWSALYSVLSIVSRSYRPGLSIRPQRGSTAASLAASLIRLQRN